MCFIIKMWLLVKAAAWHSLWSEMGNQWLTRCCWITARNESVFSRSCLWSYYKLLVGRYENNMLDQMGHWPHPAGLFVYFVLRQIKTIFLSQIKDHLTTYFVRKCVPTCSEPCMQRSFYSATVQLLGETMLFVLPWQTEFYAINYVL